MTYGGKSYQAWLLGGAAAVAMMHGGAAAAQDTRFDIAPQPLASALNEFSLQSRQSVLFTTDLANAKSSPGVSGEVEVADALSTLLAGTGLTWRRQGETFLVMKVDQDPQSGSAAGAGAEVEALIVTAQKREEDIQDVPIAISAFTQEDLTRQQIAGGPDLITQVPNMTFTKTNFSSYSVQLRGIGTQAISATTDPAVAVAFNNTPFIRNRFFEQEFYDLQRVEVLRGPQGTLYGRNATAGVVNIISQKPKFTAEAKLSGDLSNYNSSRLEGMVNIPLVEDKVALRLAGAWTKRDGYAVNQLTGNPIDGRDLWSTRVSLRIAPTDSLDVNLIWEHFEENDDRLRSGKQLCKKDVITDVAGFEDVGVRDRDGDGVIEFGEYTFLSNSGQGGILAAPEFTYSQGCTRGSLYSADAFQTPLGLMLPYYMPLSAIGLPTARLDPYVSTVQSPDLRVIESTIDPDYRAEADIGELQISLDLTDNLTLTSETAYGTDFVYSLQDFNRFNTAPGAWENRPSRDGVLRQTSTGTYEFCDPQLGCSDRLIAVDIATATARQFSQEFRLSSDFDGAFNFSLGANFLRADSEDKYYIFINSLSLYIARGSTGTVFGGPYVPEQTDNSECLLNGFAYGDPYGIVPVTGCIYMDPNPIESVNDQGHNYFLSKNPYKLISYAVFGEAYYQVTDALKVTAGLRWTVDKKEAPRIPTWIAGSRSYGYPVAEVIEQEWREPTGRLTVDWKPDLSFTDDTMVYASYAHGYKAGGANPPGFVRAFYTNRSLANAETLKSATRPRTFDAEFVDAFEIGSKNTFADGRVTMNLAAFYYDYKDYQISEIVDRSAFNRNFDATVWGVEWETDWRPLENLRLGIKGGYEKTRIGDHEQAIDLMDRTAGDPAWTLVRPFPTYASSCIVPSWLLVGNTGVANPDLVLLGGVPGGNPGGCELAYSMGLDPVTQRPYIPNPPPNTAWGHASPVNYTDWNTDPAMYPGFAWPGGVVTNRSYPGWDPTTAPNNGEGIMKPLGGNELPNAPQWTATITADYTIPLPNEWLATLHTDVHWQAESWWRVFNDHEYNRLDEYITMNLAAIFTNEERGWNIMAYIKNVTDETAITGAFLNSDDTGLTTNVFLTEPRLYGLRVTKNWAGAPVFGNLAAPREGPFPLTVEVAGQVQRHDAPNGYLAPSFSDEFNAPLDQFDDAQEDDLDWGDGREVKLSWRPGAGPTFVSAGVRFGKTNGQAERYASEVVGGDCIFGEPYSFLCPIYAQDPNYGEMVYISANNHVRAHAFDREEHTLLDFAVGRDFGFGGFSRSSFSAGVRFASLSSQTDAEIRGVPNWVIEEGSYVPGHPITHTVYIGELHAQREFEGWGPTVSWEAAVSALDFEDFGKLDVDWSVSGGALFGDRETTIYGSEEERDYLTSIHQMAVLDHSPVPIATRSSEIEPFSRSSSATVPVLGVSLGLSYNAGAFKASAGYRWERYFNAIDGGFSEEESYDRTIDGPYFKIAVGFGG